VNSVDTTPEPITIQMIVILSFFWYSGANSGGGSNFDKCSGIETEAYSQKEWAFCLLW
jgi:hypothetical protein